MAIQKNTYELTVHLRELREGEKLPELALYRIGPGRQVLEKIAALEGATIGVPRQLGTERATIGLGPDIEDLSQINAKELLQLNAKKAIKLSEEKRAIEVPKIRWEHWFPASTCVWSTVPGVSLRSNGMNATMPVTSSARSGPRTRWNAEG